MTIRDTPSPSCRDNENLPFEFAAGGATATPADGLEGRGALPSACEFEALPSALEGAGKQVKLLEYKGLDHQLADSTARTNLLMNIGTLLERTIGN